MPVWKKNWNWTKDRKASKKTINGLHHAYTVMKQKNCDHVYRDGTCIKCNKVESNVVQ